MPIEQPIKVKVTVNGQAHCLELDPRVTLLDALRDHLGLTGSKKGCDHGQCGACTVIAGGRRINACLSLAVMHDGDEITTVEGLADTGPASGNGADRTDGHLSALQQAFVDHDGMQCGYCTSGQLMSATGMLAEIAEGWPSHVSESLDGPFPLSQAELSERMSGNLCRCACYPGINAAIRQAEGTQ